MSAAHRALIAEGDRWLEQAVDTYRGGGSHTTATAEAAIAQAYFARALSEKPDMFASLLAAGAATNGRPERPRRMTPAEADEHLEASIRRHPAGSRIDPADGRDVPRDREEHAP